MAVAHGKHVLVEKPMALTLEDCRRMIDAAASANTYLIVGHSHSFDRPILRTREIVQSGAVGAVKMISAQNYNDYLYRPRRSEELATESGGGAIFSQAAHQVDIVRLLGGGRS
jgi:phthalate 4,5-cis-dihydrodiol dehydrogenase